MSNIISISEEISLFLIENGIEENIISLNSFIEKKQKQVYIRLYNGKRFLVDNTEQLYIQFLIKDKDYKNSYALLDKVRNILNVKEFYVNNNRYFLIEEVSFMELETNLFSFNIKIIREKGE